MKLPDVRLLLHGFNRYMLRRTQTQGQRDATARGYF
jgi:hypothetical protein